MKSPAYTYNADDDGLADYIRRFTSRNGDGSGDYEEDFLSCVKLIACCKVGGQFLDVGSGIGRIVDIIKPYAAKVVALEPDAERFRACENGFGHVASVELHKTVSSGFRAACPGVKFDLVTVSMVLQHVSTRQAQGIIEDVRDLLKPDGVAIISTTHFFDERFLFQNSFVPVGAREFDDYAENTANQKWGIPVRMFSKKSFQNALQSESLEIVNWCQFSYARPEQVKFFANQYNVRPDAVQDVAFSQFAVVRKASVP